MGLEVHGSHGVGAQRVMQAALLKASTCLGVEEFLGAPAESFTRIWFYRFKVLNGPLIPSIRDPLCPNVMCLIGRRAKSQQLSEKEERVWSYVVRGLPKRPWPVLCGNVITWFSGSPPSARKVCSYPFLACFRPAPPIKTWFSPQIGTTTSALMLRLR